MQSDEDEGLLMLQYASMVTLVQILVWVVDFTYLTFSASTFEQQQLVLGDNRSEKEELTKALSTLTNAIYKLIDSTNMQWKHHNTTMENNNLLRTMPVTIVYTFVSALIQWATPLLWVFLWPLWLHVRQQQ